MNSNKKWLIIAGAIVIVIAIILGVIYIPKKVAPGEQKVEKNQPVKQKTINVPVPEVSATEKDQQAIRILATTFTERFGTYSSQGEKPDFSIWKDSVTASFYSWLSAQYPASLLAEYGTAQAYSSVITQALAVNFNNYLADKAEVLVSADRVKNKAGSQAITLKQDLKLQFVKINNAWQIDAAYWQK